MQRIFSNFITPPPQANGNGNDMPWLFVTGARGLATFAGISMYLLKMSLTDKFILKN